MPLAKVLQFLVELLRTPCRTHSFQITRPGTQYMIGKQNIPLYAWEDNTETNLKGNIVRVWTGFKWLRTESNGGFL
jgi:hypothetical protein